MSDDTTYSERGKQGSLFTDLQVQLGERSYPIRIQTGGLKKILESGILPQKSRIALVTDENVASLYRDCVAETLSPRNPKWFVVPPGEKSKSVERLVELWNGFFSSHFGRDMVVVALGGGMIGDLAGFAAATYMRGVRLIQIPTTLLAMVDSSVGGKTAIDLTSGKNIIGAFHQPDAVLIDSETLATLSDRQYRAGLGEVLKYAVSMSPELFVFLEQNLEGLLSRKSDVLETVIASCCRLKSQVVAEDERDINGIRAILNYGHTFAHAYESADDFVNLLHGEAVTLGLVDAMELAFLLKREGDLRFTKIDEELIQRQKNLIRALSLIETLKEDLHEEKWGIPALLDNMSRDKKNAEDKIRLILPTALGQSQMFDDIPISMIRKVLEKRFSA